MNYQREPLNDELLQEMLPLLSEHYQEVAHYKDIKLEPDFEVYKRMQENNCLRIFTARDEETTKLLGYNVFIIRANAHYKSSVQAHQDVVFITKSSRGTGIQFISWCDEQLRYDKVDAVYHHVKAAHNFGPMLERLGYELVDLIYARRLASNG